MVKLRARRETLRGRPRAEATAKSYAFDWRSFTAWCVDAGRPSLPATAETVAFYATWLLTDALKRVSTAQRRLAAIADFHRRAGHSAPSMSEAREVINVVKRQRREQPHRKMPLSAPDLVRAVQSCDPVTLRGLRDRAVILLGFATSLRRSELAALALGDISFEGKGIAVTVRHSKTDQHGAGRVIGVWAGQRETTDPVRVLKAWVEKRGDWNGPLFCRIQNGDSTVPTGLGLAAGNSVTLTETADANGYSMAGSVTAAAHLGRSDQEIMRLSGHQSAEVMRMYVRDIGLFSGRNPLEGVL